MTFVTLRTRISRVYVHHGLPFLYFLQKTADRATRLHASFANYLPRGNKLLLFHGKFTKFETLRNRERDSELLPYLRICRKLEIALSAKICSKRKSLLQIRKVAKKLPSNLRKALVKVAQAASIRAVADNVMMR